MNSEEFEYALQGRVIPLKTGIQLSAFFNKEYTPENMVTVMNYGSNAMQYLDKQKNGLGIWKYSCNTLTSGYIFCIVNDNPPSTGAKGDMVNIDIPEWLQNIGMHALSGFLIGFCSTFVANPAPTLPDLGNAIYGASVIGLYGAVKEVAAYIESKAKPKATAAGPSDQKPVVPLSRKLL